MADTTTTNLLLTKPEVGASTDTWGTKVNTDLDSIDAVFAAAGTGTSVGLNVGSGKVLTVGGIASNAAGSAAAPTITATGDTNTGIFFPTADTLAITTGGSERVRVSSTGGLSVGTTTDSGAGAIYATGNITAFFSDDRLKTRLGNIENALDKVKTLTGFYYEANQTAQDLGYEPVRDVGVSAQQVQAVLPEIVVPAPISKEYLTVRYEKLVPLLVEAIKELDNKIQALKLESK